MWNDIMIWCKALLAKVTNTVREEVVEAANEIVEEVTEDVREAISDKLKDETGSVDGEFVGVFLGFTLLFTMMAAWITHVVTCFNDGSWGFLIAGAIAAPVAWVHGLGIWFGWWV